MTSVSATARVGRVIVAVHDREPDLGHVRHDCDMPVENAELFVTELRAAVQLARRQKREMAIARRGDVERELEIARGRVDELERSLRETDALAEDLS